MFVERKPDREFENRSVSNGWRNMVAVYISLINCIWNEEWARFDY